MSHKLFFKLQGKIMNLGNKLTVFQIIVCETVVTKIYSFEKKGGSLFYLSFLKYVGGIYFINHKQRIILLKVLGFKSVSKYVKRIEKPWFATIFG